MVKTIKEMADEYARAYLFSPQGGKGPDGHYVEGANAVLEQIEDIVYRRYSSDADGTERNRDLINLIRELKGLAI